MWNLAWIALRVGVSHSQRVRSCDYGGGVVSMADIVCINVSDSVSAKAVLIDLILAELLIFKNCIFC